MKKQKLTLEQKLDRRKIKIPNKLLWWVYHVLVKHVVAKKYNVEYVKKDDINECKGPCFIIWNHLSRYDHYYIEEIVYPRRYNMLAGHNEFFRSHLHTVFKITNIIPKKNYTTDIASLKAMSRIIKKGGTVCFSPEGMSSIYGHNQPVVESTGHFLKHHGIPVYLVKLEGAYLTEHKVTLEERLGKITATLSLLFSPEQLKELSDEEVTDKINEAFRHDDYEWQKEKHIKWKHKGSLTSHYEDMCYKCPKCGAEFKMETGENTIKCTNCGNGALLNDYYEFIPFDKTCKIPESMSKWVDWERIQVIKEIRENPNFSFTEHVKVGCIPDYKWIKDKKTSEICGEGDITIDHNGIHFVGKKNGEDWAFSLSYKVVFSLIIVTDCTFFSLYINNRYHDFIPDNKTVGKMLLLTEEMHRLHVNTWKNFPWCDYMYKGTELEKK